MNDNFTGRVVKTTYYYNIYNDSNDLDAYRFISNSSSKYR